MTEDEKKLYRILNNTVKDLSDEEFEKYKKLNNSDKIIYLLDLFGLKPGTDGTAIPQVVFNESGIEAYVTPQAATVAGLEPID